MIWPPALRMVVATALGAVALLPGTPWHWREFAVVALVAGLLTLLGRDLHRRRRESH